MNLDERLEAIAMNLELAGREIEELRKLVQVDAENIRSQVRIAEIHEHRLTRLEEDHS